ncbi:secondary thiamine-phosphate synthase enzyme [Pseudomonas sp. ok272]|uniref:YjbQ family protein n=1 Tax=unclassified Pseudomonas TaxID=196821 RepID=UPI0008AC07AC|nr:MULTISPECIES: YjbQ family protein [unclassified Pseudomonas]SEM59172.1 secondary thiamine-phosphate synthase enzyme [Pseudomonas sp. ok272]SFM51271.1 secondary thiamine-phosphate synthase enzyme [Pseudomonas sp. ok602]
MRPNVRGTVRGQPTLISLQARPRGVHPVMDEWFAGLSGLKWLCCILAAATWASSTLDESVDPAVCRAIERFFNRLSPQGSAGDEHGDEGLDHLPEHFKAGLLGCRWGLPLTAGRLVLGGWQGIYLDE